MKHFTRRRFLSVCAMAGAFSALPWASALATTPLHRWNGILLGANVSLTLAHPDRRKAQDIFQTCVSEIKRLENIFTLYDSYSELSRLNAHGILRKPSSDMVKILKASQTYHDMTQGAFDVTVKPLEDGESLDLVGMNKLHISDHEIHFKQEDMGVTLNGIAQGYITDRITELLKEEGLTNVLVELGEKRAIGHYPSGRPWLLNIQGQEQPVPLIDKALATSSSISPDTGNPHIFTPKSGSYAMAHKTISVVAENAAMADALSTGFLSLHTNKIKTIQQSQLSIFHIYLG